MSQKDALAELATVVRDGGQVASLPGAANDETLGARGIRGTNVRAIPTTEKLTLLGGLASSGELRVPIQAVYSLDQAQDALNAFQASKRGKLILRI